MFDAVMAIHSRRTYPDGADRMLFDHAWHSSTPLTKVSVGDTLRVKNIVTSEVADWEVSGPSVMLSPEEARTEWLGFPFGNHAKAERYGFYPYILRNLHLLKEYGPRAPNPRFIPSAVRIEVWNRDGGRCKNCGRAQELQFDHIVPVSKGGSNTAKNIELLCAGCNRTKSSQIV